MNNSSSNTFVSSNLFIHSRYFLNRYLLYDSTLLCTKFDYNQARAHISIACKEVLFGASVEFKDYHALSGHVCKAIVRKLNEMKSSYKFIVNCVSVPEHVDGLTTTMGVSISSTEDLMFSVKEDLPCGRTMIISIAGQLLHEKRPPEQKFFLWEV